MKTILRHGVLALIASSAATCPCLAGDYPGGYSLVAPTVIGGVIGGRFKDQDGRNIELPLQGAEAVQAACLKQGKLWFHGDPHPHTCTKATVVDDEILVLWLSPAVKPAIDNVLAPPVLMSTVPFPTRQFKERGATPEEILAIRETFAKRPHGPATGTASAWTAVDVPEHGTTYYLVPGRHLLDTNEEEECATTATQLYVKDAHGLNYSGELDAHPAAFIQRATGLLPEAVVMKDCGKQMSLWQVAPKARVLIGYSNGYEYGD